jgi:hypothetical protein
MTETEWLACTAPRAMLAFLRFWSRLTDRKLRLLGCACGRHILTVVEDEDVRLALDVGERLVEGSITGEELSPTLACLQAKAKGNRPTGVIYVALMGILRGLREPLELHYSYAELDHLAAGVAWHAVPNDPETPHGPAWHSARNQERNAQAVILRDIFAYPRRPTPQVSPGWQTERVMSLARGIYDRKAFDHLSELAYMLEEAGCRDGELLGHLRGPGPHARGCDGLDAVLGKS